MKTAVICLAAMVALAGCVTETTTVSSKPISPEEVQVRALGLDFATNAGIAQLIADDCPTLAYSMRAENSLINELINQSVGLLDGDINRAASIFESLQRQPEAQLERQVEPKLLAYIKANDYLPGIPETACRVGRQEQQRRSVIGRLLVAQ